MGKNTGYLEGPTGTDKINLKKSVKVRVRKCMRGGCTVSVSVHFLLVYGVKRKVGTGLNGVDDEFEDMYVHSL